MPEIKLTAGQHFGISDVTHRASIEYLGDLRAYMTPVKTYKVFHSDLNRIMTYPEQAKVRSTDYTIPQFKTLVNVLSQQFSLQKSAFDIY